MTIAELLALPVGQWIRWTPCPLSPTIEGQVTQRRGDEFDIVWADGTDGTVCTHDDDLAEFADNMELCDGPLADLPVVIDSQPTSQPPSEPA
jgi:hypothetical protein